jgi:hypothetical protein
MKKLLLISAIFALVLSSCSKDSTKSTSYTFTYSVTTESPLLLVNIALFEYNSDNEVIMTNVINNCKSGTTKTFTANNNTKKVKVCIEFENASTSATIRQSWVKEVFYLTPNQNTQINISDETIVSSYEP